MKQKGKELSVLYVERQQFSLYAPSLDEVKHLKLSADSIQDLEVINKNALQRQLENWFEQIEFKPSQGIVVFSPQVYFHHQFAEQITSGDDEKLAAFINTVPFDAVDTKLYPVKEGTVAVALNNFMFEPLMIVLERSGWLMLAAVPAMVTGIDFSTQAFDKETGEKLAASVESLMNFSFLDLETVEAKLNPKSDFMTVKIDRRVIAMISVFVLLIIVLGVLLWQQRSSSAQNAQGQNIQLESTPPPAPLAALQPSPTSNTTVTAPTNASGSARQAYSLVVERGSLTEAAFEQIRGDFQARNFELIEDESSSRRSARSLIIYPGNVPVATKTSIQTVMSQVDPDFSTQINDTLPANQIILIFKTEN